MDVDKGGKGNGPLSALPPRNLHRMTTHLPLLLALCLAVTGVRAQELPVDSNAALTVSAAFSVPLNHVQVLEKAREAWHATFAQEPGASLAKGDRDDPTFEGQAYVRFRSEQLVGREESMGIITYRVKVQARNGTCRISVTDFRHVGNRDAYRGPIDVGLLTRNQAPPRKVRGMGRRNGQELWVDLKNVAVTRAEELVAAFGANLRQLAGP